MIDEIITDGGFRSALVVLILVMAFKIYRARVITDLVSDCCKHKCKMRAHTQNDGGDLEITEITEI